MEHSINHRFKILTLSVAVFFLLFLGMESLALARAGSGRSSGTTSRSSSGSYRSSTPSGSYQRTAPAPMQQSMQRPSATRSFLAGLGGGMVGGMLGSMLFGGRGYAGGAGGWGGGGGFGFGDLIFLIIICVVIYFVWKHFRNKRQAAMEYGSAGGTFGGGYSQGYTEPAYVPPPNQQNNVYNGLSYIAASDPSFDEVRFKERVEDMFFKIQSAWTKRDLSPIRNLLTQQMFTTFQEDVSRYVANKQYNRLENIAVRQVDIVDAVQDQGEEYITVKFLASLLDYVVDESNQMISGSTTDPVKFLEYWTWTRGVGDRDWLLAGITQEGDY
jgi:predicted lipid-binding transport protein (Tim44 family)